MRRERQDTEIAEKVFRAPGPTRADWGVLAMPRRQKVLITSAGNTARAEGANFALRSQHLGYLCA
jgi:hypothetical protein